MAEPKFKIPDKKPEQKKPEHEKPHLKPIKLVKVEQPKTWKKIAQIAAAVVLSPFIVAGMVAGCGPLPETCNVAGELIWFPAFEIKKQKGKDGFEIEDVSLGLPNTQGYEHLATCFSSPDEIPSYYRDNYRNMLKQMISSIENSFKLENPKVIEVLENNAYVILYQLGEGLGGQYYYGMSAYKIYDVQGYEIATCESSCEFAPLYNLVVTEKARGGAMVHELLHDFFYTDLRFRYSGYELYTADELYILWIKRLFEVGGTDESSDREWSKIISDFHDPIYYNLIDSFVAKDFPELNTREKKELADALRYFLDMRFFKFDDMFSFYNSWYEEGGMPNYEDRRNRFLASESYTKFFDKGFIPEFLEWAYKDYLRPEILDEKVFRNRYFSSPTDVEIELLPAARSLLEYIKRELE